MKNSILKNIKKVDHSIKKNFSANGFSYSSKIDQLFKWIPVFSVVLFDLAGIRPKNNFKNALKIIGLSEAIRNTMVVPLKKTVKRRRPDDFFKLNSFPSGHTATSFMGAEILHQETKKEAPLLSLAGYGIAITTATLRLYKKKHWLSDVIAGAAIGILSARMTYRLLKQ
jgi:membrane-associated phospholipid phosphatase